MSVKYFFLLLLFGLIYAMKKNTKKLIKYFYLQMICLFNTD